MFAFHVLSSKTESATGTIRLTNHWLTFLALLSQHFKKYCFCFDLSTNAGSCKMFVFSVQNKNAGGGRFSLRFFVSKMPCLFPAAP